MELICPICGGTLRPGEHQYSCENRHGFDVARQGYVNLLTVQQKRSLHPGDTREQVISRRAFLDGGFYAPIARALCEAAVRHGTEGPIVDVGCGEGYYSAMLASSMNAELVGLDISKDAARYAAGRYKNALWLVYCRTGRRSADAVQKLESLGYTDLRDLGGILSWPRRKSRAAWPLYWIW